ncbi:MAG TPA: hypothetical protein VES01_02950 [Dermatophilaceae bacterium]|nr:hypothetical protein [Dermatophilaceae bacterium]
MPGDVVYARPRRGCRGCLWRTLFLLVAIPLALFALPYILGQLGGGGGQVGPTDPPPTVMIPQRTVDATRAPDRSVGASLDDLDPNRPDRSPGRSTLSATTLPAAPTRGSDLVITGTECPRVGIGAFSGIAVGTSRTTCSVATAVQSEYVAAVAATPALAGTLVAVSVAQPGASAVRWQCAGTRPATCTSPDGLLVYLHTGAAIVR